MNIVFLASSGGYSIDYLISAAKMNLVEANVTKIITDRECRTNQIAKKHNIKLKTIEQTLETSREEYSNKLLDLVPKNTDLIIISLRRLISGDILKKYNNKILNTHPSLLPSYKGYKANKRLLNDGKTTFGGCSCHIVNEGADDGPIINQSIIPLDYKTSQKDYEFRIWNHQKHNLCQAAQYFSQKRVQVIDNKAVIYKAKYGHFPTNPKLEIDFTDLDNSFNIER